MKSLYPLLFGLLSTAAGSEPRHREAPLSVESPGEPRTVTAAPPREPRVLTPTHAEIGVKMVLLPVSFLAFFLLTYVLHLRKRHRGSYR